MGASCIPPDSGEIPHAAKLKIEELKISSPGDGEKSAPDREQSSQRRSGPLRVRMTGIRTAESDHFAVAVDCSLLIFATVMSEMTLHQPGLGMMRIDIQDTVDEDLSDLPTFFGNRSCSVRPVDTDLGILVTDS